MLPTLGLSAFEAATQIFSRPDTLAYPTDVMNTLTQLSLVWACVLVAAGLLCMYHGFKYYRVVTIVMALLIGGMIGYALGHRYNAQVIVSACCALLFAVACWPFMKYAVAIVGGLVGSFVGANAWTAIDAAIHTPEGPANPANAHGPYWVGALLGLVIVGMLAFIVFKISVVFFTSISGATLAMFGVMAILLHIPQWGTSIQSEFKGNAIVLPLLVIVPAIVALILQEAKPDGSHAGPKPAAKPAGAH
ncbi:MAG: hypothetical protein NTW19_18370 [Planctomycetota bacterium]|nr:hypothetical protein [Planctomycetota bacterium]